MNLTEKIERKFPQASDRQLDQIKALLTRYILIETLREIEEKESTKIYDEIKHLDTEAFENFEKIYLKLFPENEKKIEELTEIFFERYSDE